MEPLFSASAPTPPAPPRERKARAFHRPWRLRLVALLMFIVFGGVITFAIGLIRMILTGTREAGIIALAGLAAFVIARLLAFALSRALTCPLCHGTVMLEKRCQKHLHAQRLFPLSYRLTAALSALFTGTFRCMYCGTRFRLRR